jgi:hypothetical protein
VIAPICTPFVLKFGRLVAEILSIESAPTATVKAEYFRNALRFNFFMIENDRFMLNTNENIDSIYLNIAINYDCF